MKQSRPSISTRGKRKNQPIPPNTVAASPPNTGATSKLRRHELVLLFVIVLSALSLRLIYVGQLSDSPLFDHPRMDEEYHDEWGKAIATGSVFVDGPYFRAPLYPAFLGVIYKSFGHDYLIPRIVQALLGSLSCGLLFLIGRQVFGLVVGAIASIIMAQYWMLIYFDGELLIPALAIFLNLLMILILVGGKDKAAPLRICCAGIVLGLSALARPNILLFAVATTLWLIAVNHHSWKKGLKNAGMLTLGAAICITPITIRNYVVGDDLVLIASQGGVNFFIGNNSDSDGRTAIVPGTHGGWKEGFQQSIRRAEQAAGKTLRPSEVSNYYYAEALGFVFSRPADWLTLMWRKFRLFWTSGEVSNNKGIYFWTEHFTPIVSWLPLGFGVIGPLGLVGLLVTLPRWRKLYPISGFVLIYMVSVVLYFCTARYRMPVIPLLILFSSYAAVQAWYTLWVGNWVRVILGVAILAPCAMLVHIPADQTPLRNDAMSYVRLGAIYAKQNDLDQATASYRSALKLEPNYLTARLNLAKQLHRDGQQHEAIVQYRRAIATPPRLSTETKRMTAQAHFLLAKLLVQESQQQEAKYHLQLAKKLDSSLGK